MSLPVIDIPVKLPFDVPLHLHPIFVHFAISLPIIVLLIELINIKAKNRAVSLTSLFLLTLAMIVYVGAFFTGKADGSHAFALLSADAKEELKFHKLLGTYLVYGTGVLFLFKLIAMGVKKSNWARDLFLVLLLVFIGVVFKQGKDGGELVYEYGVNVEPVTKLQDRIDEMEYDIDDLKEALKKAKEAAGAENVKPQTHEQTETKADDGSQAASPNVQENGENASTPQSATDAEKGDASAVDHAVQDGEANLQDAMDSAQQQLQEKADETMHENTTPVKIPTH